MTRFYCLVAGSRTFTDYSLLSRKLDKILSNQSDVVIVSGGAHGADTLAEYYAKERGYGLKIFHANWNLYGKSAGYKRNEKMWDYITSVANAEHRGCVCFWDGQSKGTAHNFEFAKVNDTPLRVIKF